MLLMALLRPYMGERRRAKIDELFELAAANPTAVLNRVEIIYPNQKGPV